MKHIVSISGGSASAVSADRVMTRYGKDNTTLWFADTLWEDEDLYRFLIDLEAYWDKEIIRHTDGRTPLEVAEDRKIIPNSSGDTRQASYCASGTRLVRRTSSRQAQRDI